MGIRHTQVQHLVETARTQEGLVEQIGSVGGTNDKDAAGIVTARHAVELGQQLRHNTVHDTATVALVATLRRHGIQFVKEDDAGAGVAGALEHAAHIGFRFTNVHVEQLGTLDGEEVEAVLGGNGLGEQRLAGTRRSVEENAGALLHALGKELGALERQLDRLGNGILDVAQTTDIVPGDVGNLGRANRVGKVLACRFDGNVKVGACERARERATGNLNIAYSNG